MRTKPAKKPQPAKCPECPDGTLIISYCRVVTESFDLMSNGVEGRSFDTDYSESDLNNVTCTSCSWEAPDPETFVHELLTRKVNNGT